MTRVILVGDIHMRDTSPSSRKEGYREDIIAKLEYVAELAKKIKADAVVLAGDVFHFPTPSRTSHATVLRMLEVIKKFDNIFVVPGNHDILNDRLDSVLEKQPLGVLLHGGLKVLDGWDDKLPIYGVPWQQDWIINEDAPVQAWNEWKNPSSETISKIHSESGGWAFDGLSSWEDSLRGALSITHAPIYPPHEQLSTIFELLPTHGDKSVSSAMGNVGSLYYGHIHEDHGVFEDDGVTYCNVGALSRGSLHEYNMERQIQVAIWDSAAGFRPHVIPHKTASELFFTEEHQEDVQEKKTLDAFLSDVGQSKIAISSIESVKNHIESLDTIDKPVREKAIAILDEIS